MGDPLVQRVTALAVACLWCGALRGQEAPPTRLHVVKGVVFDSVAGTSLSGAEVQLAARTGAMTPITTTADANGRYRLEVASSGGFIIGFYHPTLDVLGLDGPARSITLAGDSVTTVELAIPSSGVVRRLRCGADSSDNALLTGRVRLARSDAERRPVAVSAEWGALVIDRTNLRTITLRVTGIVDANGNYQVCGVPASAPITMRVTSPGARGITGTVEVPASGVGRRDFVLADSAAMRGSFGIRGRVLRKDRAPVQAGRASIADLGREVPIKDGAFALLGLPEGTWLVNVRAMGLDPSSVLADATDADEANLTVALDEWPQYLEAVTVVEKVSRLGQTLDDVLLRQRTSSGSFFFAGHPALKNALFVADVFKSARGFTYKSETKISGRMIAPRNCQGVAVYLNGMKIGLGQDGFEALLNATMPKDVLAIEAYNDVLFAPMQWRTSDACSVVAVWTKY